MSRLRLIPPNSPSPDAAFEAFWDACPRKVDRALTWARWSQITSPEGLWTRIFDRDSGAHVEVHLRADPDTLLHAMRAYRTTQIAPSTRWEATPRLRDDGRYTIAPATWLNRGRWLD